MSIEGMNSNIEMIEMPAGGSDLSVAEVMTTDVIVVSIEARLDEAQELLVECGIHGAPVIDGAGRLQGVVSQTDLLRAAKKGMTPDSAVSRVMSRTAYAVRPETDAAAAAAQMIGNSMRRLIVVDHELKLVGIVAALDLLRLLPGVKERIKPSGNSEGAA